MAGLIVSYFFYIRASYEKKAEYVVLTYPDILLIATLSFFLVALSGITGFSYQTNDYVGHNSKFYDLSNNAWPVYFKGVDTFGCYYWGFYLIPALVGKLTGQISEVAIFLWTYWGILMGVTMTYILVKKDVLRLLLFFLIGGIGHTVKVLFGIIAGVGFTHPIVFIEVWNMLNQLLWAPNQFIPSMLLVALIYSDGMLSRNILSCFFPLSLVLIWSVFPSVTLSFIALFVFFHFGEYKQFFKIGWGDFFKKIAIPGLVCLPILCYFLSSSGTPIRGFIWTFDPIRPIIIDYIVCVSLDIMLLGIVWKYLINNRKEVSDLYFFSLLAAILIFGLFRFGFANDWLIRGTMPILMLLFYAILRGNLRVKNFSDGSSNLKFWVLFSGIILLCMVGPFSYFYRAAKSNILVNKITGKQIFIPYAYDKYPNIYEAIKEHHSLEEASQYLGDKKSAYWKYLSRRDR
ncbi:hypothetical protein [Dyadobacter sp. LHD-138]|uniref:hypothetical protein n=1 Tax=Dyadobacter sp. LHD-138 TaxID=3071413 RepID=UPI0027DF4B4A|nr:hypothetical protein [Dyadobacter sp. LHD-138]MDQ6477313.1 hypothetical protein [Dyadobacter sp. LHD-138]